MAVQDNLSKNQGIVLINQQVALAGMERDSSTRSAVSAAVMCNGTIKIEFGTAPATVPDSPPMVRSSMELQ